MDDDWEKRSLLDMTRRDWILFAISSVIFNAILAAIIWFSATACYH